jgi:hypothetical protein
MASLTRDHDRKEFVDKTINEGCQSKKPVNTTQSKLLGGPWSTDFQFRSMVKSRTTPCSKLGGCESRVQNSIEWQVLESVPWQKAAAAREPQRGFIEEWEDPKEGLKLEDEDFHPHGQRLDGRITVAIGQWGSAAHLGSSWFTSIWGDATDTPKPEGLVSCLRPPPKWRLLPHPTSFFLSPLSSFLTHYGLQYCRLSFDNYLSLYTAAANKLSTS